MNTLASWIDADAMAGAVRDLAPAASLADEFAALTGSEHPVQVKLDDFLAVDLTASPAGNAKDAARPAEEPRRLREMLEEVKRRACTSGLLPHLRPGPPAAAAAQKAEEKESASAQDQEALLTRRGIPYFTPPLGPMGTRIRALMDYLKRHVVAESIFILDGQGCPVSDHEPPPQVLAAALLLSDAARRASRHLPSTADGALHVDLPQGEKLCVIHTETRYGHFCLSVVGRESMPAATADRLRRALKRAVESDGTSPTGPVRVERW